MSEELAKRDEDETLSMIERVALDPRIDVEKLERLLAMKERVLVDNRRIAFEAAMARLQEQVPQINKYGQGKNSKFAKLEDIDVIIRPLMAAEGFSVTFDEESHTEKTVTFVMRFAHREGHSESKRLTVPIDVAAKNREGNSVRPAIQDAGSTVSYARRYLLKMHLNIIETNEDTDGESKATITPDQAAELLKMMDDVKMDRGRFLVFMGVGAAKDILARDWNKAVNALEVKKADNAKQGPK